MFSEKKNVSSFCKCKSYSHFFSKHINVYAIFNDQNFNDTLTNDIVSFEQPDPGSIYRVWPKYSDTPIQTCLKIKQKSTLLPADMFKDLLGEWLTV